MIYYDDRINRLAAQKADEGCRESIKQAANCWTSASTYERTLRFYNEAFARGHLRDQIDLTIVMLGGLSLFFEKKPEEVEPIIAAAQPKVAAKVPEKVLVRMLARRIDQLNNIVKENNRSMKPWYSSDPKGHYMDYDVGDPPEFRTIADLRKFIRNTKLSLSNLDFHKFKKEIEKNVLSKPELLDQHVSDAMDLVIAGEVMET